jgi:dTDP-4-amino-4,6-dideoxygalactose transaminase
LLTNRRARKAGKAIGLVDHLYPGRDMHHGGAVRAIPLNDLDRQHAPIAAELLLAVERVFASQQFILGDEVLAFEHAIASRLGARHAFGVANGSDALLLALVASDVGPGDEVITTPLSFFATAGAIARVGARPVFVDIEPEGFHLDPDRIVAAITDKTRAILPVHLFGKVARIEPMVELARARGLVLIEDAAQAIDARRGTVAAGCFGDFGCLSFHPSKNLGALGDGGMVLCQKAAHAERIARLRVHGGEVGQRHEVGLNSRLDALQAALLLTKLRHLSRWNEHRRLNAQRYRTLIAAFGLSDFVRAPEVDDGDVVHQFTVRARRRDELAAHLAARGIATGRYYSTPLHLEPCFAKLGFRLGDFPRAEAAAHEMLSLPVFPELTGDEQQDVVATMASFYLGAHR